MDMVIDANIFLAVIMNEPEKKSIIERTQDIEIISPAILPYEIGNALIAIWKRNKLAAPLIEEYYQIFLKIPVRLVEVKIIRALAIARNYKIYAYDAYYLEVAKRLNAKIMTLDKKIIEVARDLNIDPEVVS